MSFVSPDRWVIGVDDTDMPDEGGTGQLARRVAAEIWERGLGVPTGVTRHQLYEGPGVPKTSRNSTAAIEFAGVESPDELFRFACEIVAGASILGSDPGVALAPLTPSPALLAYSQGAQQGLVDQDQARRVAAQEGVLLAGLGGDEGGVIGAVAAVGLRIGGNDGRFVGLDGIREVAGPVPVGEFLEQTDVIAVVDEATGERLQTDVVVDLGDWVRPRLVDGQPVLIARRNGERWSNADARPQ
ncbi:MAG: ABC transporter substrate-binding protein [bacterium]|nr:ABC transporter substrate-binding protein [bacterium]